MSEGEEWDKQTDITIATIRSTAKRTSMIQILKFLNNHSDAFNYTEISEELDMDWMTVKCNIEKLLEAGFIREVEDKIDGRCHYFQIADKEATEKAIEYWEDRQRKLRKKEEENKFKPKVEYEKPTEVEEVF
jgi:DNA-binding MarR family transcriptional regulator